MALMMLNYIYFIDIAVASFLQHPFFLFDLLQDSFFASLLEEVFSDLEYLALLFEQEAFSDLEQDLFFSLLQQVPFFLFSQVASQIFPVFAQVLTFSTIMIS